MSGEENSHAGRSFACSATGNNSTRMGCSQCSCGVVPLCMQEEALHENVDAKEEDSRSQGQDEEGAEQDGANLSGTTTSDSGSEPDQGADGGPGTGSQRCAIAARPTDTVAVKDPMAGLTQCNYLSSKLDRQFQQKNPIRAIYLHTRAIGAGRQRLLQHRQALTPAPIRHLTGVLVLQHSLRLGGPAQWQRRVMRHGALWVPTGSRLRAGGQSLVQRRHLRRGCLCPTGI